MSRRAVMAEIMSSQPPAKPTANCKGFGSRKCDVILADLGRYLSGFLFGINEVGTLKFVVNL